MSSAPDGPSSHSDGTPEAIEAAIKARRTHLAGTLDELAERVRPANLANDAKEEAVTRARVAKDEAVTKARDAVTDTDGNLLYERVAAVGAAAVAVVVGAVLLRRRSHG